MMARLAKWRRCVYLTREAELWARRQPNFSAFVRNQISLQRSCASFGIVPPDSAGAASFIKKTEGETNEQAAS